MILEFLLKDNSLTTFMIIFYIPTADALISFLSTPQGVSSVMPAVWLLKEKLTSRRTSAKVLMVSTNWCNVYVSYTKHNSFLLKMKQNTV